MKIGERNASNPTQLRATVQQWATYLTGGSLGHVNGLSPTEKVNLERGLERLKSVGRTAVEQRLRFLVDGEYTYLNPAISVAALSMSAAFNSERPVVWNTYQCYLRVNDSIPWNQSVSFALPLKYYGISIQLNNQLQKRSKLCF